MGLQIKPLKKQDYSKAIQFAIRGMNFDRYMESKTVLDLYGRYFWYMEMGRASQIMTAYSGDELAGVLLAEMKGEPKAHTSFWESLYVRIFDLVQHRFAENGVGPYDSANQDMLKDLAEEYKLDGEICFLAANPDLKIKGVGSLLLSELEKREPGKRVYLFTDSNCTYQFYEHRGFERVSEKKVTLGLAEKGDVEISCYLYSKVIAELAGE